MSQPIDRPELTADAVRVLHSGREFRFVHDDAGDHIYSTLRTSRSFYEITLLDELARLVPRGAVAIDVGANIGNHAVYFAGVMGCKVIAFEPNTRAASLLKLNAELNALTPDIEIRECAAGAHRRRARMTDGEPHNLGTAGISAVESGDIDVMPLDELAIDGEIGLLKIDVEGMEADVLAGARELLRRHKPVLAIEARQPEEYLRIVREIAPLGYMPVGSFNYTPTHIFRTKTESETADTYTTALSHRLSLQYIDTMARTASVDRRFVNIQGQLSQQTENDRAASAKIDAIESKQTDLSDTLAQTNKAFASLDERSTKALATLQDEIRSTGGQLAALAAAITRVGAEIKALRSDNETNTAKADARFGELRALAATLEDSHTAIRQDITASLSAVLNQVSELDTRFRSERSSVATAAERAERQIRALEENSTARAIEQGAALQHLREAVDSNRGQIEQRIDGIETALYRTLSEHHRAIASLQGATDGRLAEVAARLESVLLDLPSIGRELEGVGARIGELETRLNNTPQPDLSNLEVNTFRTVARVAD
ncbi:MAG: FkbM family methyltransferase, partial [Hyphomicrobiaceae bacterium]